MEAETTAVASLEAGLVEAVAVGNSAAVVRAVETEMAAEGTVTAVATVTVAAEMVVVVATVLVVARGDPGLRFRRTVRTLCT